MILFKWHKFSELSGNEVYEILALRSDIFVVEQHCVYLDPDGKDLEALHLMGTDQGKLVAYLRLFPSTEIQNYLVFGRVVTARFARAQGLGKQLLQELIHYCDTHYPDKAIQCSAQYYLKKFYESFGFVAHGNVYDEDGIPHIAMSRKN